VPAQHPTSDRSGTSRRTWFDRLKRVADAQLALCGLAATAPLLVGIAAAIKASSPGPVFYRGRRAGLGGRPFEMLKFRTMVSDADRIGGPNTSGTDPRVTPVGRFLRRFKLDELPQLLNVLRGDMSLVGPRPEVLQYVEQFGEEEREILEVRPGITDWASIWNANEGEVLAAYPDPDKAYEEVIRPTKLRLQLKYARERSLPVDLRILTCTALKLVRGDWLPRELEPYGRLHTQSAKRGIR
jgi:lipopolysaccharide/colanic/teichoic acid biosynthesis glycosyltransferase